jgi:hypothetical protein
MTEKYRKKYRVSKQMRDILVINQSIIENLKAQKARSDKMLDKYQHQVRNEADLPSNRFLNWTRLIDPYSDAVISSKVTDYELQKRYEVFIKELVAFEQSNLIEEGAYDQLTDLFNLLVVKVMLLETRIQELKKNNEAAVVRMHLPKVKKYQKSQKSKKFNDDEHCKYCGTPISPSESRICDDCTAIPAKKLGVLLDSGPKTGKKGPKSQKKPLKNVTIDPKSANLAQNEEKSPKNPEDLEESDEELVENEPDEEENDADSVAPPAPVEKPPKKDPEELKKMDLEEERKRMIEAATRNLEGGDQKS